MRKCATVSGESANALSPGVMRFAAACLAGCAVALAIGVPSGSPHAVVRPSESRPAELQLYTLIVPTERDVPTVEVDLRVPQGIDFLLVDETGGWQTHLMRTNGRIEEIMWTGASVPPKFFATFRLIARNPILGTSLSWRIVQRYSDGKAVRWIGPSESDTPAATTKITESAVPVDVVAGLNGGGQTTRSAAPPDTATGKASSPTASSGGRDGLTFGLAIAACAAAIAALGWILMLRRTSKRSAR
jgi:uncharacterized protein YcnI